MGFGAWESQVTYAFEIHNSIVLCMYFGTNKKRRRHYVGCLADDMRQELRAEVAKASTEGVSQGGYWVERPGLNGDEYLRLRYNKRAK